MRGNTVFSLTSELRTESRSRLAASRFAGRRVHFIGIGGCGMAGLARMLLDAGAVVSGSDPTPNEQTFDLARRGAKVSRTQLGELIDREVDLVVRTAAVPDSNPEYLAAVRLGLPTLKYAQLLGQVMAERYAIGVSGTHGKTTTTSMIAHALVECGADPSFVIGGTVPQLGGSSRSGGGRAFVVEACEYDRSFHNLRPAVAVITNIEADHLDCYKDLDAIVASFRAFAELTPAGDGGLVLANGQDANVARAIGGLGRRVETVAVGYSENGEHGPRAGRLNEGSGASGADWETAPLPLEGGCHGGVVRYRGEGVATLRLAVPGAHNLYNATVALAACHAAGADVERAAAALGTFRGVDRRMTEVGSYHGARLIDDYGHHPTEIAVTLGALRERYRPAGRLICVFQPHQHSRTRTLFEEFATCFGGADLAIIADIYSVRDSDEERRLTTSAMLVDRIKGTGQAALHVATFPEVVEYLKSNARDGDLILTIGAGNVCDVAHELANLREA